MNIITLQAGYITVVEDRPIMSAKYCLPVLVFHFWPKPTHLAVRSLCDSWATCYSFFAFCDWVLLLYTYCGLCHHHHHFI